jgi:3-oxoacyl-[acyl-carrier protein] reductase
MDRLVNSNYINKVVLITGGSSGIGLEIAKFFIKKKATVIVCSKNFKKLKKEFKKFTNVYYRSIDVSDEKKIIFFVKDIIKKFKKIHILINNAGININSNIDDFNYKDVIQLFKINFFSYAVFIREVSKIMKKINYGRIVNVSSGASVNCIPGYFAYSASKSSINVLTKTYSKELGNFDIKINSMSPGACKTRMFPRNKLLPKVCIPTVDYLSSLKKNGPSGKFFSFMCSINVIPKQYIVNKNKYL